MSGEGASSPKIMVSQKTDYTHEKEEEWNGNNTGAVQQSGGELPGRLAAPCFGVSAPSPTSWMDKQTVSFLPTSLHSVRKSLWKGEEKEAKEILQVHEGAVLLQNPITVEKLFL